MWCFDDGWTYYANVAEPNVYLFAYRRSLDLVTRGRPAEPGGNTSNFTATVYLTVSPTQHHLLVIFFAQDLSV